MSRERLNLLIGLDLGVKRPWIGQGARLWFHLGGWMAREGCWMDQWTDECYIGEMDGRIIYDFDR
jgi:hypothetical protein